MALNESETKLDANAESELWFRWCTRRDEAARDALATYHLSFARMMAAIAFSKRTNDDAEFDDYLQSASVGLMQSIDRFNPDFGIRFRTFASKRVSGAIVDGISRISERSQQISVYHQMNQERLAVVKAEAEMCSNEHSQIQNQQLNIEDRLFDYLGEVGIGIAIGILLEGTGVLDSDALETRGVEPSPANAYYHQQNLRDIRKAMQSALKNIPANEARVIHLHYLQEVPFESVANLMDVSRARVSQIHRSALNRLREWLKGDHYSDIFG